MATILGPSSLVREIFNNAKDAATEAAEEYTRKRVQVSVDVGSLRTKVPAAEEVPNYASLPASLRSANFIAQPGNPSLQPLTQDVYDQWTQYAFDKTSERIMRIYTLFMPEGGALDEGYLKPMLTDELAGTGIDPSTEAARIAKERNQILGEGQRMQRETIAAFAARRFPLPPGPMVNALHTFQTGMMDRVATLSNELAAERAEAEAKHRQQIIEYLVSLRLAVIRAAGELMSTVVGLVLDGRSDLVNVEKYNQEVHNLRKDWLKKYQEEQKLMDWRPRSERKTKQFEYERRKADADETTFMKDMEMLVTEAQAIGSHLAALRNALHGSAGTSGSGSTSVSYNYGNDTTEAVPPYTGFS